MGAIQTDVEKCILQNALQHSLRTRRISSLPLAGERPGERVRRSLQLFEYTGFPQTLSLTLSRKRERECPVCLQKGTVLTPHHFETHPYSSYSLCSLW